MFLGAGIIDILPGGGLGPYAATSLQFRGIWQTDVARERTWVGMLMDKNKIDFRQ